MRNMFYNYDNNCNTELKPMCAPPILQGPTSTSNTAYLYSIQGKPLGIEVKRGTTNILFFHLTSNQQDYLEQCLAECQVRFELYTLSHKQVFSKTMYFTEIFNTLTDDLEIILTGADTSQVKQETYRIKLSLIDTDSDEYPLYGESDGLLVIR